MSVSPPDQPTLSHHEQDNNAQPPSTASSPDDAHVHANSQEPTEPSQKRRSGRKLIYATSEERKQRNRQAQAAFRERRTEYIKLIEVSLKQNEEIIEALRQSERGALEECQILRQRNVLLEQLLADRGIDFQAELHARGDSTSTDGYRAIPGSPKGSGPVVQQAIMNRHQQAHPLQGASSKAEQGAEAPPLPPLKVSPTASPLPHLHPASHVASPTNASGYRNSPMDGHLGRMQPHPGGQGQQAPHHPQHHLPPQYNHSSYPPGHPNQVPAYHHAAPDVSSYHYPDGAGFHTPTSMDEGSTSYQSSMNQNTMNRLGAEPEPPFQMPGHAYQFRQSSNMGYYPSPAESAQLHGDYGGHARGASSQRPDFYPPNSSSTYATSLFARADDSMLGHGPLPHSAITSGMQFPSQYVTSAEPAI